MLCTAQRARLRVKISRHEIVLNTQCDCSKTREEARRSAFRVRQRMFDFAWFVFFFGAHMWVSHKPTIVSSEILIEKFCSRFREILKRDFFFSGTHSNGLSERKRFQRIFICRVCNLLEYSSLFGDIDIEFFNSIFSLRCWLENEVTKFNIAIKWSTFTTR